MQSRLATPNTLSAPSFRRSVFEREGDNSNDFEDCRTKNGSRQGQHLAVTLLRVPGSLDSGSRRDAPQIRRGPRWRRQGYYLTQSVSIVVLQKSTPPQICELSLYYYL